MLQYILECIAFQLLFLIIYDLFLKRETFFQWNRFYLIGTYIISMILPWIKIEAMKTTVPESFQAYPEFLWNTNNVGVTAIAIEETSFTISWEYALLFGGMFLATLFFAYKLYQIYSLKRKGDVHYFKDFTQIIITNSSIAFSFFKSIFLGDKVVAKEHRSIVQHELVHIRQRHSYDLMFFELMRIVSWFNPLVYVYQSRVSELHEFIADAQVAKTNKKEQYEFLLSQVFQTQNISFINQFFKSSLIKKRIVMLTKEKSKQVFKLKYLLLLPMLLGILCYTSCQKDISNSSTIIVADIAKLTAKEERKVFDRLISKVAESTKNWELFVKDKHSSMKFVRSNNGSYLSGPNGEKIYAKLAIDSKLGESEMDLFTAFLGKEATRNSKIYPTIAAQQYDLLVAERQRLLLSSNEKNPIIVNLDQQINQLRHAMSDSLKGDINALERMISGVKNNKASVTSLNQLIAERERLLQNSNAKNPIIVNLDQQIKALKRAIDQENETVPFATVDNVPVFPGCEDVENKRKCFNEKMQKHISKNFNYPQEAQDKGIQGRVAVMFTISSDGSIQNIRKRGPDALLENEVERIIKRLPQMKAGRHKGKAVNVPFSIPVTFKLQEDKDKTSIKLNSNDSTELAPLVIIDGKESSSLELHAMSTDDIESMNVIKDKAATRKYGSKGKNGVIVVITKKKF